MSAVSWNAKRTISNKNQFQLYYYFIQESVSYHTVVTISNPGIIDSLNIKYIIPFTACVQRVNVSINSSYGRMKGNKRRWKTCVSDKATWYTCNTALMTFLYWIWWCWFFIVKSSEYATATYYPGQQLRGEMSCLERATWLKSTIHFCAASVRKNRTRDVTLFVESVSMWLSIDLFCRFASTSMLFNTICIFANKFRKFVNTAHVCLS